MSNAKTYLTQRRLAVEPSEFWVSPAITGNIPLSGVDGGQIASGAQNFEELVLTVLRNEGLI